ncbi:MAG TPA: hypothetical protein VK213_09860 [Bacteroidales bacterium]|nr:hypothetical protein [Bacteroidales bacterium]
MFIKIILLSVVLLTIAAAGFGIRMLLKPKARFPELHISGNEEMRKRGITCASQTNLGCGSQPGQPGCNCGKIY